MQNNQLLNQQYYLFALIKEYEPFCPDKLIHIDDDVYGIHGLWPHNGNNHYSVFCDKSKPLDESKLDPIKAQLTTYWHSSSGKDANFWSHEWLKHGTCITPSISEYDYFSKALELYQWVSSNDFQSQYDLSDYKNESGWQIRLTFDNNFCFLSDKKL